MWAVLEIDALAADLLAAAMKVCDRHNDGPEARDQMRRECLELPPHLQRDLLQHFTQSCPTAKGPFHDARED